MSQSTNAAGEGLVPFIADAHLTGLALADGKVAVMIRWQDETGRTVARTVTDPDQLERHAYDCLAAATAAFVD
jgi:hypothetical protein